jgi:DNA-directed RNA polymerase specialized sigma24 family protein
MREFLMFRSRNKQKTIERATEYASCKDFQQIFNEDMVGLHRLALMLTADQAKAEQCFVAGLEDSIHGNPVFRQWARAWSKRAIIQSAIKALAPAPTRHGQIPGTAEAQWQNGIDVESIAAVVASWEPFERFVFVMAVLEGYGLRECAALLACPVQDVITANHSRCSTWRGNQARKSYLQTASTFAGTKVLPALRWRKPLLFRLK